MDQRYILVISTINWVILKELWDYSIEIGLMTICEYAGGSDEIVWFFVDFFLVLSR